MQRIKEVSSDYTLKMHDQDVRILVNSDKTSTPIRITLPDGFPAEWAAAIHNNGDGAVYVSAASTLDARGNGLLDRGASTVVKRKHASNEWTATLQNVPEETGFTSPNGTYETVEFVAQGQGVTEGVVIAETSFENEIVSLADGSDLGNYYEADLNAIVALADGRVVTCGNSLTTGTKADLTTEKTQLTTDSANDAVLLPGSEEVYVSDAANQQLRVYDTTADPLSQVTTIGLNDEAFRLTYNPDDGLIYAPLRNGELAVVDPDAKSVIRSKSVGTDFTSIAIYGDMAFCGQPSNPVVPVRLPEVEALPTLSVQGASLNVIQGYLYALNNGDSTLSMVNAETHEQEMVVSTAAGGTPKPIPYRDTMYVGGDRNEKSREYGNLPVQ